MNKFHSELENALAEVPFVIRMTDGEKYKVLSASQIHIGEHHIVFIDHEVIPHILMISAISGIIYASPVYRQVTKELESIFEQFRPFTIKTKDGIVHTFRERDQLKGSNRMIILVDPKKGDFTRIDAEDIVEVKIT